MSEFLVAFERMIENEGGYKLHTVKGDTGGMTYAGIARNSNPQWEGWAAIDRGESPPEEMVKAFYKHSYWDGVSGDAINAQPVADSLFDFAVNGGVGTARKLAQKVVKVEPDGVLGEISLAAINKIDPEVFVLRFALAKIGRYREIVTANPTQIKFLLGWINRALKGIV